MSGLLFKPNGLLDIATAATDLPATSDSPGSVTSEALTRCKNLRIDRKGLLQTRDGSSKINSSPMSAGANFLLEQGGSRYSFSGSTIFKDETTTVVSGLTDAQWSAIKYNQYNDTTQQVFALNGTDLKRIEGSTAYQWGITAPSAAPTSAVGSSTGLTGDYSAKTTYCRKVGSVVVSESNPSSASVTRTLANQSLSVTWVASSDPQVTHVRVYRTLTDGSSYFHDQDIAIGTLTVDTNTADADLGDLLEEDHDRPPLGQFVSGPAFDGTCFIVKENLLYFCKPKQPEYWPTDYFIEVSTPQAPGKCPVTFHNGQPHFLTKNNIYLIQGTGQGNLLPIPLDAKTGAQGPFGVCSVKGKGLYHTGPDGIYLLSGNDLKVSEVTLDPIFRGETVNGIPGVDDMSTALLHQAGNYLYFWYQSAGYDYPTNVLVLNLDTNRTSYFTYDDGTPIQIRCLVNDVTNSRILAADTSGYIRKLEDKSVTTDSGEAIDWEVQSMDYTLQTRRHFPRWAKYDVDASSATSCTGEIIVDGATVQSHTISGSRNVRYRHITTCNGKRCAIRISGSGPATVYAAELE